MKIYEKQAVEFAAQYKAWELQCVAKDSYLEAYRRAMVDIKELITDNYYNYDWRIDDIDVNNLLNKQVEVEFKDGKHQLIDDITSQT